MTKHKEQRKGNESWGAHSQERSVLWTERGGEQDNCFGEAAPLLGPLLVEQHII